MIGRRQLGFARYCRNSARKIATRKAMPNNRCYSVQDARDKSCWNELKRNGNGETESKRNAPATIQEKCKSLVLVIGCSQLTAGNDGDEHDSITYYAHSYGGQYRCHVLTLTISQLVYHITTRNTFTLRIYWLIFIYQSLYTQHA